MHLLAAVLIPFDRERASVRPLVARDAAAWARLDTLMYRYEEPGDLTWGVGPGCQFDWWELGGRYSGWGRDVRALMVKQHLTPSTQPIPRFLKLNAIWSEDVGRVRLITSLIPVAVVTPHGDWIEGSPILPIFGKATVRQRKATVTWLKKIRRLMTAYPHCLAVGVDYHS